MNQPTETAVADFDGCTRKCRQAQAHTLVWGECEHAQRPEPTVSLSRVYTATDGHPSIGFDTYTVPELARLIEGAVGDPLRAAAAARAIVHRHDPAVSSAGQAPATDHTDLRAALDGLHTLIATSSRDWGAYRVDAWIWAVLRGWDCEATKHDDTCTHGALEEMAAQHGWDADTVAKARRYRAAVRAVTDGASLPAPTDQAAVLRAAECSAQHRQFDDGRLCIRAAQHHGDHIDERGYHWSDTVAVYPVADGTFRTGTDVRAELRRLADETPATQTQPDTCRSVEVDGQTISVRGSGDFTEQDLAFFGEVVRAAKRRYAAEHPDEPAAEEQQDEPWPVKGATRRYAEELRSKSSTVVADGHAGWACDAGAQLLISATTPGPGALGTHHGTIYACPSHQGAALQRITGAGYEADPRPAPPGHRWNPWPCGHVTAHDADALTALTAAGARQDGAQPS